MFNRKAKEIAWLSGRLEAVSIEKENFQALATTYWDTAEGLANDVTNLTLERNQWKSFGERWSQRYDDLAATNGMAARWAAYQETMRSEHSEKMPEGFRAITEAGAKAISNLPYSIAVGNGHIINPDL